MIGTTLGHREISAAGRRPARACAPFLPIGVAALSACAGGDTPSILPARELRLPLPRDIRSLDPVEGNEITTHNVIRLLYEGLIEHDPETLAPAPRIARAWSVGEDRRSWTFELRPEARFRDDPCFEEGRGRTVTAMDAKYSIERSMRAIARDERPPDLPPLVGLSAWISGGAAEVAGLLARTPTTLEIRLERPDPLLLHELAHPRFRILPREAVEAYGADLRSVAVGSGPFRVVSWEAGAGLLLVRNLDYWDRDPQIDALRLVPVWRGDLNRLYAENRIDVVVSYTAGGDPGFASSEQRFLAPRLNTIWVQFDFRSSHPMVSSRDLRRAVSAAVPRPVAGLKVPARGLLPPGLPGRDPALAGQATDRELAADLLRAHGAAGPRPLRLAWADWDRPVGEAVAGALRSLGIPVELALLPAADFRDAVRAGRTDLFRAGWIADYPDPQTFLQLFHSASTDNDGRYSNPEYDALLDVLRGEEDPDARARVAGSMERILIDDVAAVFLHHETERHFVSPRVENWETNCTNPLNVCFYERVRLRDDDAS